MTDDMEALIEGVALPWLEEAEQSFDTDELAKAGQAVRDLLKAYQERGRALESAAETLDHVDGALTDMADAGAVPAVGTWRFVTQAAKRARAALRPTDTGREG